MSDWEERRKAEEAGRSGGAAPSNQYLDDWQRGKSIAEWNKAELERQQAQSSAPPLFSAGESTGSSWSSSTTTGSWSSGSGSTSTTYSGGGAGCLMVPVLAILGLYLWPVLYPFSTLASLASVAGAYLALDDVLPKTPEIPLNGNALVAAAVVGLVVLWTASRLDHRLARHPAYRIVRHVVRLVIIGLLVSIKIQGVEILGPGFPRGWRLFADPVESGAALAVVVAMHFVMWTDNQVRETWHGMLEAIRLR